MEYDASGCSAWQNTQALEFPHPFPFRFPNTRPPTFHFTDTALSRNGHKAASNGHFGIVGEVLRAKKNCPVGAYSNPRGS